MGYLHASRWSGRRQLAAPGLALVAGLLGGALFGAAPAAAQGEATLQIDLAAEEKYRQCLADVSAGRDLVARACLQGVIEAAPESTAALKAKSALNTLKARRDLERSTLLPADKWPFEPGRLELTLASGAFGVLTGAGGAAVLASQPFAYQPPILPMITGAGGAAAVALGGAFALGGFFLGELLDLKGGTSRLVASGMAWGSGFGIALAPWMFTLVGAQWPPGSILPSFNTIDFQRGVPLSTAVTLLSGYAGLAASSGAAFFLDLSPGQVSLINTGVWSGLALGILSSPLLGLMGFGHPGFLGVAWILGGALGMASGAAGAFLIDFDVWEVLCVDAAGLAALGVVGGLGGAAAFVTGNLLWLNALLAGVAGAAMIGALAAATAGMAFFRIKRGKKVSRLGFLPVEDFFAPPTAQVVRDKEGRTVPIASFLSLRF